MATTARQGGQGDLAASAAITPKRLVFVGVRLPRTVLDRLDTAVAQRAAGMRVNPPRRSDLIREALTLGLDAIEEGVGR